MKYSENEQKSEVPFIFVKYYEVIFKIMLDKHFCIVQNDYFGWLECIRSLYLCVSHKDKKKEIIGKISALKQELLNRKNNQKYWFNSKVSITKRISDVDVEVMEILGNEYIKKIDNMNFSSNGMDTLNNLYKI